jgi:translation initiation factor 5
MSKLVNINFSEDPSYRYKMPVMQPRIEGRGNGIKTAIDNMSGLASALGRDPRRTSIPISSSDSYSHSFQT